MCKFVIGMIKSIVYLDNLYNPFFSLPALFSLVQRTIIIDRLFTRLEHKFEFRNERVRFLRLVNLNGKNVRPIN